MTMIKPKEAYEAFVCDQCGQIVPGLRLTKIKLMIYMSRNMDGI